MSKQTKNILITLLVISALAAAGLLYYSYFYEEPAEEKVVTAQPVESDPETQIDEQVKRAGKDWVDEIGTETTKRTFYLGNVEYLAEDLSYQPIDTTIVAMEGDYSYKNTTNTFKTFFKDNAREDDLITVQMRDRSVSFSFVGANEAGAVVDENTLTYPEIYDGIDAKYTVGNDLFLEELVANKQVTVDKISQKLKLDGIYYKEQADGSITFHNQETKKIIWLIPAPVMYEKDEPGNANYDLHYEITEEDGGYLISKVIDPAGKEWLVQANYPVVIDATLEVTSEAVLGGHVYKRVGPVGQTGYFVATGGTTYVGNNSYIVDPGYAKRYYRRYFTFDTSSLAGASVSGADFYFYSFKRSLDEGEDIKAYSGADEWSSFSTAPDDPTLFEIYNSMTYETTFDTTVWNTFSDCGLPEDCEALMPVDTSSISTTGYSQFVLTEELINPPPNPSDLNGLKVYGANAFPAWRMPRLVVEFPFTPPALSLSFVGPASWDSMQITLTDLSGTEDFWVLERSYNNNDWEIICEQLYTGKIDTQNTCRRSGSEPCYCTVDGLQNTFIEYNCSATSIGGTGNNCTIIDSGVGSDPPNTLFYYRAKAGMWD